MNSACSACVRARSSRRDCSRGPSKSARNASRLSHGESANSKESEESALNPPSFRSFEEGRWMVAEIQEGSSIPLFAKKLSRLGKVSSNASSCPRWYQMKWPIPSEGKSSPAFQLLRHASLEAHSLAKTRSPSQRACAALRPICDAERVCAAADAVWFKAASRLIAKITLRAAVHPRRMRVEAVGPSSESPKGSESNGRLAWILDAMKCALSDCECTCCIRSDWTGIECNKFDREGAG